MRVILGDVSLDFRLALCGALVSEIKAQVCGEETGEVRGSL